MSLPPLGADLRALRKTRGLTLDALASELDRSVGWLSQVERDMSTPSPSDLQALAQVFDVPVSLFFANKPAQPDEAGYVVRGGYRRRIGSGESGLTEELLSPDLTDSFEVVHSTFAPGATSDGTIRRETQEVGYLVSGKLDLWIDDHAFHLSTGDSFRIRNQPYSWSNPHSDPAIAVWVISPPVY